MDLLSAVYVNGIIQEDTKAFRELSNNNIGPIATTTLLELNAGDVLDIRLANTSSANRIIYLYFFNFTISKVGNGPCN